MALITCPDCNTEMSDQAPACPKCGRPRQVAVAPTVIEQTGKGWKKVQLWGALAFFGGVVMAVVSASSSSPGPIALFAFVAIGGVVTMIVGRVGAWWHHG